jgi:hypothetical protein
VPAPAQSWARLSVERLHVRGPVNDDDEQARLLVYGSVVLRFVGTEVAVGTRSGHLAVRLKSARALADPAPPPAAVAAATCWHHPSPARERISCAAPSPRQPRTGRSAARAPAIRSPRPCRPVSARVASGSLPSRSWRGGARWGRRHRPRHRGHQRPGSAGSAGTWTRIALRRGSRAHPR